MGMQVFLDMNVDKDHLAILYIEVINRPTHSMLAVLVSVYGHSYGGIISGTPTLYHAL